jgi:hypothetical protein
LKCGWIRRMAVKHGQSIHEAALNRVCRFLVRMRNPERIVVRSVHDIAIPGGRHSASEVC